METYAVLVATPDMTLRRAVRERLGAEVLIQEEDNIAIATGRSVSESPDLVVVTLSGYCAIDTIRHFRSRSQTSMLALVDPTVDVVDAIDAGADDYLRLPCSPREIVAKVRSAMRRRAWTSHVAPASQFADLVIDREAREVRIGGEVVTLPQREYELLAFLASSPRRVFSRTELLEEVWEASTDWLGPATVTEHVRRLRGRLAAVSGGRTWVCTVRGAGYRFDP